ncbi:phosphatidylserine/phosphatidylglycerophosphate/cardiolipin synthase family protein [Haloferax sp. ATB1]|uniref:phospholipase D-like domain-containing protein n=1 Tax=Haloferax sp. ATB1 TaxID=1508454 RepID=UPI0005B1F2FB|nr:phosphatidylserine/phosphatidylglycerophosphate/cardiolipin synthase family protein [Haloferax sp. ATB1]
MTDGHDAICTNFAVVRQFDDVDRVVAIRDNILGFDQRDVTRDDVDRGLETPLTTQEAAALFTCLQKNGAATQSATDERGFAAYTFEVDPLEVDRVLTQQAAVIAAEARSTPTDQNDIVEFVATLPGGFEPTSARVRSVPDIASTIRNQVFDADSSVRIANPYFDPSLELVSDLASLPRRGVETHLLTRETADEEGDTRTTLNKMWNLIDEEHRDNFEVRDLYRWDEKQGSQAFATHAKIVIVDERVCYVGSANLTDTSLSTNFEFGVVVEGDIVEGAATVFDEVFEYSHPVDLPI